MGKKCANLLAYEESEKDFFLLFFFTSFIFYVFICVFSNFLYKQILLCWVWFYVWPIKCYLNWFGILIKLDSQCNEQTHGAHFLRQHYVFKQPGTFLPTPTADTLISKKKACDIRKQNRQFYESEFTTIPNKCKASMRKLKFE